MKPSKEGSCSILSSGLMVLAIPLFNFKMLSPEEVVNRNNSKGYQTQEPAPDCILTNV